VIVDPGFLTHWKTLLLKQRLGEAAPCYVIALWSYCQTSRKNILDVPREVIPSICGFSGDADTLIKALVESRFIDQYGDKLIVHQWDKYNGKLISNWENGNRGGRPLKNPNETQEKPNHNPTETQSKIGLTQTKPTDNPNETHDEPNDNPTITHAKPIRVDGSREDKTREDNSPLPPFEGGDEVDESSSFPDSPAKRIKWTPQSGWNGLTQEDVDRWHEAYPACEIQRQLKSMNEWLLSHPERAKKKVWMRFITNWLSREQDRGGDMRRGYGKPRVSTSESDQNF
jgi:hypothetical protein